VSCTLNPKTKNPASQKTRPGAGVGPSLAAFVERPQAGQIGADSQYINADPKAEMHPFGHLGADFACFWCINAKMPFLHQFQSFIFTR
jgi:hypothetical protein